MAGNAHQGASENDSELFDRRLGYTGAVNDDGIEAWLREVDATAARRVVQRAGGRVLVSKVDDGFAARLHAVLADLPELFQQPDVIAIYADLAQQRPGERRVVIWQATLERLLAAAVARGALAPDEQEQLRVGIESVVVVLDAVLWSLPPAGPAYTPLPGEVAAYRETVRRMNATPGLFTRSYGVFAGEAVESHCPAARVARVLLAQGWRVCTGTEPPRPGG